MAFFVLGINVGPVLGPIACGSVAQKAGFRWVFGFVALVAAAVTIISLLLLDETHPATIAARRTNVTSALRTSPSRLMP